MDPTIVDPEVSSTGENQATFTIGEIAHEFGLILRALRFYEDGEAHSLPISRETCVDQIRLLESRKRGIEAALAELRRSYSQPYLSVFTETEVRDAEQRNRPSGVPSMFPS